MLFNMKYVSCFFVFISYVLMPKFCVHCEHFIPYKNGNKYGKCKMFPEEVTDQYLITGQKNQEVSYHYCSTARKFDHMCGEQGKLYAPFIIEQEDL